MTLAVLVLFQRTIYIIPCLCEPLALPSCSQLCLQPCCISSPISHASAMLLVTHTLSILPGCMQSQARRLQAQLTVAQDEATQLRADNEATAAKLREAREKLLAAGAQLAALAAAQSRIEELQRSNGMQKERLMEAEQEVGGWVGDSQCISEDRSGLLVQGCYALYPVKPAHAGTAPVTHLIASWYPTLLCQEQA